MKPIKTLLAAALAAAGMAAAADAVAQEKHGFRGHRGGGHHGHHGHHGHRHHWHGPRIGLAIGVPLAWGWGYGWGPGWYDPWYYGGPPVVYREREVIREVEPAPESTQVPRGEGAPTQGPMYMNYCESAKAYFPKVTQCPEGWKLTTPTQ